ncbi:cilia- and flagella-associated protein 44 isoform X1 [Anopheles stephensi]|uniref:cilia- and flagella-associated protein 44 isoform X1 n=1 Tax=Anopheles stephensi TaxID=30069 RepID=UPI001658A8B8|nr:cilia- and flagella-associated protein 44 isoform X1 [Anopheles stephensi]
MDEQRTVSSEQPSTKTGRYDGKSLISKPIRNSSCTIPNELLEFDYSYGYDCKRYFNLCKIAENVLVFASGNLIHFFDVGTRTVTTRRSSTGGGIGCITTNPSEEFSHLTVGENGPDPPIIIYQYPEMTVVNLLTGGTTSGYSRIDYTVDGKLLISQGIEPDYMLTVWNWSEAEIILRCKSFSNDVLNVMFSPSVPGHITTCGLGHIKFWKMSSTFTGLKLQGELGRFGKTEISDIVGILPLPDEKVLSGCQWGNVLVWEAGLIKLEVCRKARKPCHDGPITQILMREGEVMTAGLDGRIRIWFWETVELADPPDDDRFVEIEPIMEFRIGAELMCLVRRQGDFQWYAQDGSGGIWLCDLTPAHHTEPPQQLFKCHAGAIVSVQASPVSSHVATLGKDGMLCVYDYAKRELLLSHRFQCAGQTMVWLPPTLDPTGAILVLGFADGFLRTLAINLHDGHLSYPENRVNLIQLLKPHSQSVTALGLNVRETILVSGSEDKTVFVHRCVRATPHITLEPIGLVYTPSAVTSISWKPDTSSTALVGCRHGQLLEVELPETSVEYTTISFHLRHVEIRQLTFQSVKSEIKRNLRVAEIENRKQEKRARKLQTLERLRIENPKAEINEEAFLADSDEEEELEPLYIPKVPNPVLWARYTDENTLWLSMGGYDAGYVYEYGFDDEDPLSCTLIPDLEDIEMTCYLRDTNYTIFGTGNGAIRVNRTKRDFRDLSDYWTLPMHDNRTGRITALAFSHDFSHIFSVGEDGNLFAYRWYGEGEPFHAVPPKPLEKSVKRVFDIDERDYPSLEEQKAKQERDRLAKIVSDRKEAVLQTVAEHRTRFEALLERNRALPEAFRIPVTDFVLDERIMDDLREQLEAELGLVHRKMAFDVEKVRIAAGKLERFFLEPLESYPIEVLAVRSGQSVKSFRIEKLDDDYYQTVEQVERLVAEEAERRRRFIELCKTPEDRIPEATSAKRKDRRKDSQMQRKESFLEGLSQSTIDFKLESKMRRLLAKYRDRKNQETIRQQEWEEHKASKPDPNANDPADDIAIKEAAGTIGDYNLKSDPDYEPTEEQVETATGKYHELLRVRKEMFTLRKDYNKRVFALRERKVELMRYVAKQRAKLKQIHEEIPQEKWKQFAQDVTLNQAVEYADDQYKFEQDRHDFSPDCAMSKESQHRATPNQDMVLKEVLGLMLPAEEQAKLTFSKHERELRELRLIRKLFKQDKVIDKATKRIEQFDRELAALAQERLQVETDAKLLENFQLTLYQELWILKDFSKLETDVLDGVEQVTVERNELLQAVQDARSSIEQIELEMEQIQREQRSNLQRFNSTCLDNEFSKVMKRIYKKKFKPCKINDNDSDSSSEYSSEDIEGLENANEGEVSKVFLDLNHCPAGCDPEIYNLAIQLRNEKLELQRRHYAEERTLKEVHRQLENLKPTLADAEARLRERKAELLELRREKQRRLNDIDTLIIVRMDQMQYFRTETEFHDVENSLLFNREALLKLYARVEQLAAETLETKRKHRVNVVHLARMKTDIKFMRQQLVSLKEEISETMMKKFGRVIDLDELEETILRQYTFEMRANLDDVKKSYEERARELKKMYANKQEELKKVIQEGTEKLHILTVLQEEYNNLVKALAHQTILLERRNQPPPTYSEDLTKLREIAKIQKEQINTLQREIRTLSMKCKPLSAESPDVEITIPPPVCGKPPPVADESVYNTVMDSAPPSTRASSPDNFLYNEISSLIDDFLVEQLGSRVLQSDIKRVVNHLAHYLSNIIHNFAPEHASDLLPHIIENFKSFIPEELLITIPPQAIAELIESIFRTFKEGYDIDTKEILGEIVSNSLEMIFPASQNYSHNILVDIMKQVLATLHVADVNHPDTIAFIANGIRHKPGIDPDGVNVELMCEEILLYAQENTVDEIGMELVRGVIEGILQCVREQ